MEGIGRCVGLPIRRSQVDPCFGRLFRVRVTDKHLQSAGRPAVDSLSDFDLALFAAIRLQKTEVGDPVLIRHVDDPLAVG